MPRAKIGQKDFAELVNTQGQGLFDKNYWNILRDEDLRKKGRSNIGSSNKTARIP